MILVFLVYQYIHIILLNLREWKKISSIRLNNIEIKLIFLIRNIKLMTSTSKIIIDDTEGNPVNKSYFVEQKIKKVQFYP